jgi:preprotein translocase SecE subunit
MAVRDRAKFITSTRSFFTEVGAEIKKIVWPTREVLTQATTGVVAIVLGLVLYIGFFHVVFRFLFDKFESL